ncbi:MAG TPA: metal ABC transporter permease [Solirubrobacteraceae bacterium]|nr:metal ABC transporter permease [Solirubrobacteraceae bacterium]
MRWLTDPLSAPFMQRALLAALALSVAGGLLGTWIVLRRLAFFAHAVGSATFPGLVVAGPWGIAPQLAALAAGLGFAGLLSRVTRSGATNADAATGLLLAGALALGSVLASDVYRSGAGVDRLLFGTLLGLGDGDVRLAIAVAVAAAAATAALARTWLATGFDPAGARALGVAGARGDWLLLALLAATVVAVLPAVGALLVSTLLVVPAATARLLTGSLSALLATSVALAAAESVAGLLLAYHLDLPPGPAIAIVGGAAFAAATLASATPWRRGAGAVA